MKDSTTKQADGEDRPMFGPDTIEAEMRRRVRETIEAIVKEEFEAALGAGKSARVGDERSGCRHGSRERTLTTSLGPATIRMPRARIRRVDGATSEWGVVARIVNGPHKANRQDPHLPMRYDTGRPRALIRLRISQPRTASLPCPAGLRARRLSPMMDL